MKKLIIKLLEKWKRQTSEFVQDWAKFCWKIQHQVMGLCYKHRDNLSEIISKLED
jgi:hypothetical protein